MIPYVNIKEGLLYLSGLHLDIPIGPGWTLPDGRRARVLAIGLHSRSIAVDFYPELARLNKDLTSVRYVVE